MKHHQENFNVQIKITIVAVTLLLIKLLAYFLTGSIAILTDALESIVNVLSGFIGLYSFYLSARPKDTNHPYGHGKIEFLSAGLEGGFMLLSAVYIFYEAILHLLHPHEIRQIDYGFYLILATALINYYVGYIAIKRGKKNNSLMLVASGKHLQSDTLSTLGILIGLILIYFTNLLWIDSLVAMLFSFFIMYSAYKILRSSVAGIMDEADNDLLEQVVKVCNQARMENWIDLHNLRIIKYGSILHIDCHLTLPWYFNISEAHAEVDAFETLVRNNFGQNVELFIHVDHCVDYSCKICPKDNCQKRKDKFVRQIEWTASNVLENQKHKL